MLIIKCVLLHFGRIIFVHMSRTTVPSHHARLNVLPYSQNTQNTFKKTKYVNERLLKQSYAYTVVGALPVCTLRHQTPDIPHKCNTSPLVDKLKQSFIEVLQVNPLLLTSTHVA